MATNDSLGSDHLLNILNKRLVELDELRGSDGLAIDVANSLQATLSAYAGDLTHNGLIQILLKLHDTFLDCRPRIANAIFDLQHALLFLMDNEQAALPELNSHIRKLIEDKTRRRDLVAEHAMKLFQSPHVALIHSHSRTLLRIFENAAKACPQLKIILASQSAGKTRQMVKELQLQKTNFEVVPEYAISHVVSSISIAIFGALTLNREEVITGPGSASLLSQLRNAGVASYVALTTDKFSYWKRRVESAFRRKHQIRSEGVEYERHSYSHDIVPLPLFSAIISEKGILTAAELDGVYTALETEFRNREKRIEGIVI